MTHAGAVDFLYLEEFVDGDRAVVDEILALFLAQAEVWRARLEADDEGWREVVHTIKGSARGVGAKPLGDAAERAERAGSDQLTAVRAALEAAVAEVAAYRAVARA